MQECFVCKTQAEISTRPTSGVFLRDVQCPVCGKYAITETLAIVGFDNIQPHILSQLHILSGVLRANSENKNNSPTTVTENNVQQLIESASLPNDPIEAIDRILNYIHERSGYESASEYTELNMDNDYPIVFAKNGSEFEYLLNKASEMKYVESAEAVHQQLHKYRLSIDGWKRIAELKVQKQQTNQAFVAMWFCDKLDPAWKDGFKCALKATGYKPIRVDLIHHNEKICDRIIAEIRKSGLLVADFTGQRGGVYFEAGFAMGLDIPIIWTCRKDHIKKLHFDTRQFNHVVWEQPNDLRKKLIDRIEATITRRPQTPKR